MLGAGSLPALVSEFNVGMVKWHHNGFQTHSSGFDPWYLRKGLYSLTEELPNSDRLVGVRVPLGILFHNIYIYGTFFA